MDQSTTGECADCGGQGHIKVFVDDGKGGQAEKYAYCHCRIEEWEKQQAEIYLQYSSVFDPTPGRYTFDNFEPRNGKDITDALIHRLKQISKDPFNGPWVTILGPVGTGKSHLMFALYGEIPAYSIYLYAPDLTGSIFNSFADRDTEELLQIYMDVPVLLIDDYGTQSTNETVMKLVGRIVDYRYRLGRARPTVIASNLLPVQLRELDQRIGDRILDTNLGYQFGFQASSFRSGENAKDKLVSKYRDEATKDYYHDN